MLPGFLLPASVLFQVQLFGALLLLRRQLF
jgi:hypothetical protein